MRNIINSAFVSLDGVTEDPGSWATFDPTTPSPSGVVALTYEPTSS